MTGLKRMWTVVALGGLISTVLSGCLKSTLPSTPASITYVNVMHMAPWSVPVQIYLNNSSSSSTFPPLTYSSLYSGLEADTYDVKFKKANSDSLVASIPAASYDSAKYYTLLTYNDNANSVKAVRIQDAFSNFPNDKIHIRFWHLGPDAPEVDVYFDSDLVASNRQYTDNLVTTSFNIFQDHEPGYFKVYVKEAGTDNIIAQTTAGTEYAPGGFYTIFLEGLTGNVTMPLSVGIWRAAK